MMTLMQKILEQKLGVQSFTCTPDNKQCPTDIFVHKDRDVFQVNLIKGVYRSFAEDFDKDLIGGVTDYYIGSTGIDTTLVIPAGVTGKGDVWTTICKSDNFIGWVKQEAYLTMKSIYFDQTPAYTPTRFINRAIHVLAGINREMGIDELTIVNVYMNALATILFEPTTSDTDLNMTMCKHIADKMYLQARPDKAAFAVSADGLVFLKNKYDRLLQDVLQVRGTVDEGEDPEYYTKIFPDYETPYGITIYTQIGSPRNEFLGDNIEDWRFSLSINPVTFTCKYAMFDEENPDVANADVDIFDPDPRVLDEPRKSALAVLVDALFEEMRDNQFSFYKELYTVGDQCLMVPGKKEKRFKELLLKKIRLDYPASPENKLAGGDTWMSCISFDNGITLLAIGKVMLAVAIDGVGLIDSAIEGEITKDMSWDDIFYNVDRISYGYEELSKLPHNFEFVDYLNVAPESTEGITLLAELGVLCARILYQMSEEEDVEHE